MDYVLYSTSNSDYQSWQCKLLEWSFRNVGQSGKLIRLVSYNTHEPNREFDTSDIAEVVKLPDYRTRWTKHTNNIDKDYGIVNKTESLKYWLKSYKGLKDEDTVLLIDPDMIFMKKVDFEVQPGIIIGQRWLDGLHNSKHFKKYSPHIENKIKSHNLFMYPYAATVGDLKKIVERYSSLCYEMRLENYPDLWESEMFSLIIASIENVIVKTIDNFGLCIGWNIYNELNDKNFVDNAYIIHYPGDVLNTNNSKIFNKQDYTVLTLNNKWTRLNITNSASSYIERKFLNILENYNLSKEINFYWKKQDLLDSSIIYDINNTKKYVVFNPWPGGFNNIRMSLEIAASIAYLTNRILVLPDAYSMYLLKNVNHLSQFFDLNDLGIKTIELSEFKRLFHLNSWNDIKEISYTFEEPSTDYLYTLSNNKNINEELIQNRKIIDLKNFESESILFFDRNLLGNFYLCLFSDYNNELLRYVCRHIHYKENIFNEAQKIIEWLNKENYYSIHIRRGDFQYKDMIISAEQIYNNIKQIIPDGSTLYISTDETDKTFFYFLLQKYKVYFFDDVRHNIYSDINEDLIGPIEQIICANAKIFIGSKLSTFSSYIYRLRGYMDNILDKRLLFYQNYYNSTEEEKNWWIASWAREYDIVWKGIYTNNFFNKLIDVKDYNKKSIFVSIASYRDPQLEITIDSLLSRQSYDNNIIIGVCMQDTLENFDKFNYKNNQNVKVEFINYKDAKGVCWARNLIQQKLYNGEDYYLQIDSHSRVCKNWDKILISQLDNCLSDKAILSTYPNSFDPTDIEEQYLKLTSCPYLKIQNVNDNKKINVVSAGIVEGSKPMLGFWVAAGFLFTKGSWVKEVPYTTDFYFIGEEDYLSIKSFENGWDVYVPEKSTIWHDYTDTRIQSPKKYRPLHWEDHPGKPDNLHILQKLHSEAENKKFRNLKEFFEREKSISKNKTDVLPADDIKYEKVTVIIDWNKILLPKKNVKAIIFAFKNNEDIEITRSDIYNSDAFNRNINNIDFIVDERIIKNISKCVLFYMYEDDTFDTPHIFELSKNNKIFSVI